MTDRYVVIGNPVEHSLSPEIHHAFAEQTGQALEYGKLLAPPNEFAETLNAFFAQGGRGANVTLPFKAEAHAWVDKHDPQADTSGAVNTIAREDGAWVGYNTDGLGLLADLEALEIDLEGRRALLIGAGGAARGIIRPLLSAGLESMVVANRTVARAEMLVAAVGHSAASACDLASVAGPFDVVINSTSAGLTGDGNLIAPAAVEDAICYDLLYGRDRVTPFCAWAAAAGASRTVDGLGMLVEQAAAAFAIWRGVFPDARAVLATLQSTAAASDDT